MKTKQEEIDDTIESKDKQEVRKGIPLHDGQLFFIEQCKKKGYSTCIITVNGEQVAISI